MREQCLSRQAAGNGVIRRAALMHAIRTTAARVTRANGHAHAELRWHHIQPFRAILTNAMHLPPAAGAALIRKVQHMLHPLKMRRQGAAIALTWLCGGRCWRNSNGRVIRG
jgi:glucose-6-phosphate dehydrogenase assembly protein OpcA